MKDTVKRIVSMWYVAKREGLFALETFVAEEPYFPEKRFVEKAVQYLCEGMPRQKFGVLLSNRIMVETDAEKKRKFFLYKSLVECIWEQEILYFLMESICSLMPEEREEEIWEYMNQLVEGEEQRDFLVKEKTLPEQFARTTISLSPQLEAEVALFEEMLLQEDESYIQSWLKNMEHFEVCGLLLAGKAPLRERILSQMSSKYRVMIMEDVIAQGNAEYDEEIKHIISALRHGKKIWEKLNG